VSDCDFTNHAIGRSANPARSAQPAEGMTLAVILGVTHAVAVGPPQPAPRNAQPAWHARPIAEVTRTLGVDLATGLSSEEVELRARIHGPNTLAEVKERSLAAVFVGQLASPLIYLLFAAAAIAMAM
jgi:magnesium-transporting ATPase (P-type)